MKKKSVIMLSLVLAFACASPSLKIKNVLVSKTAGKIGCNPSDVDLSFTRDLEGSCGESVVFLSSCRKREYVCFMNSTILGENMLPPLSSRLCSIAVECEQKKKKKILF